jgi:thiol-disulfide isomerase/thioredoxin
MLLKRSVESKGVSNSALLTSRAGLPGDYVTIAKMLLGFFLTIGFFGIGCSNPVTPSKTSSEATIPDFSLPPGNYPNEVLAIGEKAPSLEAEKWLNGSPPKFGDPETALFVIDIWASWCPFCRETASGLVKVYNQFKDRKVTFISITNMGELTVNSFVDRFSIPWSSGASVPPKIIAGYGAWDKEKKIDGYEVIPTLYILHADGKVLWNDSRARYRHRDPKEITSELTWEIEKALAMLKK